VTDIPNAAIARRGAVMLLGLAGIVACLTLFFLAGERLQDVGGSCASGGPYVVESQCPKGLEASVLLATFGFLISLLVYVLGRFAAGPQVALLSMLAYWLILPLPILLDGDAGGADLVVAVAFTALGLVALGFLLAPKRLRSVFWNDGREGRRSVYRKGRKASRSPERFALSFATNELDAATVRRIQVVSAALHVAALPIGIALGALLFDALTG
jgi:hypothetical protein